MHLAASFTMVTNYLHGPDRGRAEARGVGGPAREGEWGGLILKEPEAAVEKGTDGAWTLCAGRRAAIRS